MIAIPQQLEFDSLLFKDRTVLYVGELAGKLRVSEQHITDLIEEGTIQAIDVSGDGGDTMRVPTNLAEQLAHKLQMDRDSITMAIDEIRSASKVSRRRVWRIPTESWRQFLADRHSLS